MAKYSIDGATLTALAAAIREKTGGADLLTPAQMVEAVGALGLPSGWATGQFNATGATVTGGFDIEHGLGAVPDVVVIFRETEPGALQYTIRGAIRFNTATESVGVLFYDNSATAIASTADISSGLDTDTTLRVPDKGSTGSFYIPRLTYRWVAVRLEG